MRRSIGWLGLMMLLALGMAACDGTSSSKNDADTQLGLFDWERDPEALVLRLDSRLNQDTVAHDLNIIPPCTVWGDGRVVWTTLLQDGSEQVLEGRVEEEKIRTFLEDMISRGFYTWEDELAPPGAYNPEVQSITVTLYGEVRTVRRYSSWPQNGYAQILENCQYLSEVPVQVEPDAGWISAYPVPRDDTASNWLWMNAPFSLNDLVQNKESKWLEGPLATEVWRSVHAGQNIQVLERSPEGYKVFQVAIVVPGYSRDATPPPDSAAQ